MKINLKYEKKTLANINKRFKGRIDAIKFVDDYGSIILEAKRKEAEEEPKPEPSKGKSKHKKSPLDLHKEFTSETKNDENSIIFSKRII